MPTVNPAGILSLPLKRLRDQIAASATFQAWVGAGDATGALDSIHYLSAVEPATLPLVILDWGSSGELENYAGGVRNQFEHRGEINTLFKGPVSRSDDVDEPDEVLGFMNTIGAIVKEISQLAGVGGYLDVTRVSHEQPERPTMKEAKSAGDYWLIRLSFEFRGSVA